MGEGGGEEGPEAGASFEDEGERGGNLFALSAVSVSGFLVGLLVRGEAALAVAVAVLAPALVWSGWWLRTALPSSGALSKR